MVACVDVEAPQAVAGTDEVNIITTQADTRDAALWSSTGGKIVDRKFRRIFSSAVLIAADTLAIIIGFLLPHVLYIGPHWSGHGVVMAGTVLPLFIGVSLSHHAYSFDVLTNGAAGMARTIRSFLFAVLIIALIAYSIKAGADFSRAVFLSGTGISLGLIILFRLLASHMVGRILGGSLHSIIVVVDGVDFVPQKGDDWFTPPSIGFDPAQYGPYELDSFASRVRSADRLLIACSQERYQVWASVLRGLAVQGEILAEANGSLGIIALGRYGKGQTMQVSSRQLSLPDRILKRFLDVVVAGIAVIILSPLLIATAIAIRMESRGSPFFVQSRIGRDNRLFPMYKFRSMFTDKCDANAAQLTQRNDARVTRVGNFIRRTSIDELPQLLNVLKGDMSIVGPRPHAVSAKAADILYWDVDPRYRHRHSMKPGITGLAQVRGHRGNTERTEDLINRLQADLEYQANWSIWRDISIIFQTIGVLRHDNAF